MESQESLVIQNLVEMGFDEEKAKQAYKSSDIKTVEGVINQIEKMESAPESNQ